MFERKEPGLAGLSQSPEKLQVDQSSDFAERVLDEMLDKFGEITSCDIVQKIRVGYAQRMDRQISRFNEEIGQANEHISNRQTMIKAVTTPL